MEEMADALAGTVEGGLSWKESFGPQDEEGVAAIFAVLRYEDSLSKRASSIDSFRAQHSPKAYGASAGSSPQTTSQVDATKQPSLRVLFSTDMAGRGLDIPDVTHVIHYDLPPDADTYVHRSGRTGRFGRSGQVLSIITEEQEFVLRRLTNKLSVEAKCVARQQSRKQN
jgi:ERCC4-related helicase